MRCTGRSRPSSASRRRPPRSSAGAPQRPAARSYFEFLDPDVAELDVVVVPEEADVAARAEQARVLLEHRGIRDRRQVGVEDRLAVEHDRDLLALRGHFLHVPLAGGLHRASLGRDHVVDAAVVLRVLQRAPLARQRRSLVDDLQFHPLVGGVALARRADAEAVVGAFGRHLELEPQHEVAVLLVGEQLAAATLGAEEHAVLDAVPLTADRRPASSRRASCHRTAT